MYERFTDRARKVMQLANQEAQRFSHEYIGTEHLLLGLIKEGSGVAANVLKNLEVDLHKVRLEVEKLAQAGPDTVNLMGKLPQTPGAKRVIEYSIEEARNLSHNYVGTEHLLLGLLREQEGVAAQVLMNLGLRLEDVREEVLNLLGHNMETDDSSAVAKLAAFRQRSKTPALDSFGVDLTERARAGRLPPVAGHAREIEEVVSVLLCRGRRGALLVGHPGIAVTGVAEGLAQLIAAGDVPLELKEYHLIALDLPMLVAGTDIEEAKGQAEQRLKAILAEARQGGVVLFLRDLRLLFSASASDLASLLWTAVGDRQLLLLAAATPSELRDRIEPDALLRDLFQVVPLRPPAREEVLATLRTLRPRYESHHQVRITDGALEAAVCLAERHLPGRSRADAALQLLDRAGALRQLRSRAQMPDLTEMDTHMERLNQEKEVAVSEQDFEKAAQLRDRADKLKKEKEDLIRGWIQHSEEANGIVDEALVAEVVGVVSKPTAADEAVRLRTLEEDLLRAVVGQREAVAAVARAVRRRSADLADANRPLACFLFVGPPGAGKSLLARRLAERLGGDANGLQSLDMAQFATPESGERLAEVVGSRPGGVLVFDRIDRAHASVRDRLLPLLEEGILAEGARRLDFRDSVLILTTTVGSEQLLNRPTFVVGHGADRDPGRAQEGVLAALEPILRPELLARVELVLFRGLSHDDLREVVDRELETVTRLLAEKKGLTLVVAGDARELLVDETPPSEYGAHPVRRLVERLLLEPLAEELLRGHLSARATITVHTARNGSGRHLIFDVV